MRNYQTSINVDKSKQKEIKGFTSKIDRFAKSILPKMGDDVKLYVDISEVVGMGVVVTLYIYGYNKMYDDEMEFDRLHNKKEMEKQVGSIVKTTIGEPSSINASTYWTAKKKLGNKSVEIGPYVEIEFYGDSIYENTQDISEGKVAKVLSNDYFGKLSYAFNKVFDESILKFLDVEGKVVDDIGLRISKDNKKALAFVDDYGFKKVNSVGLHSQDKPTEDEVDYSLSDKEQIAKCLNYISKVSGVKRLVSIKDDVSERKIIEAADVKLSKEDDKNLEKTLLRVFKVHEAFKRSPKLDAQLQKFGDKYANRWLAKGHNLRWKNIYIDLQDFFGDEIDDYDPEKLDYIMTYISILIDDLGIDSSEVEEAVKAKKPIDLAAAIRDYNSKYSDDVDISDKAYKIYKSTQKDKEFQKTLAKAIDNLVANMKENVNEARKKDGTDYTPEEVMYKIETNDLVLYGAIKYLYNEQTQDEKSSGSTREHNGRGFNAYDAEFMSSLAEWLLADPNHKLSAKQKEVARKKLKRYKTQLTALANRG